VSSGHQFGDTTRLIHGYHGDESHEVRSHAFPVYETSTFRFDSVEQGMEIFAGNSKYDAYSRISNPNHRFLEKRLCILEDGETAQVFDSGMTAIKVVLTGLLLPEDEIIAHRNLYGGTVGLLKELSKFGVLTKFVDAREIENVAQVLTPRTIMIYLETPSNPLLDICDFEIIKNALSKIDRNNILIVVDNTFATPCNQKPLTRGADISIHSLTKYINGFGNATGGAIITSSKIMEKIWERYHGSGGMMDPEVAQRIAINMMSLPDRMDRHNRNGYSIAVKYLNNHPLTHRVYYPGLPEHYNHITARELMTGFGGMVSFELKDIDGTKTKAFLNKLAQDQRGGEGIITLSVSLGCVDSMICCPALSTHYSIPPEERLAQGITDNLIRLSVGIEDVDDILYSLERGFEAIR